MTLRSSCRVMIVLLATFFLVVTCYGNGVKSGGFKSGQKEPSKERTTEIQQALVSHGYQVAVTGKWDEQTKTVLYKIADDMGWQVNHVPDARVLLKLGLGGKHQNPAIAEERGNHLDKLQRHELKDLEDSEN